MSDIQVYVDAEKTARFWHTSKKAILLVVIVIAATIALTTAISILLDKAANLYLPSIGTIKTIEVEAYWDRLCEHRATTIDWGAIWLGPEDNVTFSEVGSSQNVTLYIKSISNIKISLSLNATNWNPAGISPYVKLSWNYNGTLVSPGEAIQITLALSVSSSQDCFLYLLANDLKSFSLDIIISAQEHNARARV